MSEFKYIRTNIGEAEEKIFSELPRSLYSKSSPRFVLGHEPVSQYLEGLYILLQNDMPVGRFSIYENPNLKYQNKKALCIGSYECVNVNRVAKFLIRKALEIANDKGYQWLIGPMEGSTWQNYRFSVENSSPNFFMEPYHHEYYNQQFLDSGFRSIASYVSNLDDQLSFDLNAIQETESDFVNSGAIIRKLNMNDLQKELKAIGQLSIEGFAHNFLFTPIILDEFVKKYEKMKSYFDSELTWIIEDERQEIHGFIFAVKDYLDPKEKTIIIKSIVRKKNSPFKGIGQLLSGKINMIARQMGCDKVIHAFMINENASQVISERLNVKAYKSYELYALKT